MCCISVCRIPHLWSLLLLSALKRIDTMFPWRTAGMPVPSFSSRAFCDQRMDGRLPKIRTYKPGPDDIVYTLVFFSTFEELKLPIKGPMEDAVVIKLYEPSPTPCLYVADVQNMMDRVPLTSMPLFLAGNSTPTIPDMFSKRKDSGFPYGCADAAATDRRRGSNVFEVNPWLWQFGRCKPRLGGLTIEETTERKDAVSNARHKSATATVCHRKANPA